MVSKSFKEGFVGGFTSPFTFIVPHRYTKASNFEVSVGSAWSEVGNAISGALEKKGRTIGKATTKNKSKPRSKIAA